MKINNNLRTGGLYTKRPYMMQIEEKGKLDYITKFDYFLMGTVLMISLIGLVFLESAMENMYLDGGKSAMLVQIVGLAAGVVIAIAFSFADYYLFRVFSWPFYAFNVVMMLSVFTPLGIEQYGSRAWINIGITTYQPSELMKLAMVLVIAQQIEYIEKDTTYDSREYSKLIVFYHYFRDDLTEFTQGLLFSSFHEHVAFLLL